MRLTTNQNCPCCQTTLSRGITDWHLVCKTCTYEAAIFSTTINKRNILIEENRANGLAVLRDQNFNQLINVIRTYKPNGSKLLDVGSAHGWFIKMAKCFFQIQGIEPDTNIFNQSEEKQQTLNGYFPEILPTDSQFDVIVFNDVFEHIQDPKKTLSYCAKHLRNHGILVLNLPSSDGILYRIAYTLAFFGLMNPFNRMWQVGFPSPHLHYFNEKNLITLLEQNDFKPLSTGRLASMTANGLWNRISMEPNSFPIKIIYFIGTLMLVPFIRLLAPDIVYVIATRKD